MLATLITLPVHAGPGGVAISPAKDPQVIYDSGNARPITAFIGNAYERLHKSLDKAVDEATAKQAAKQHPVFSLPIRTDLPLARFEARARTDAMVGKIQQAFFLVGSDDFSRDWLAGNHDALAKAGAIGFLVQADSEDDIRRIQAAANGLQVTPLGVDQLVHQFGIPAYPALVTKEAIAQ